MEKTEGGTRALVSPYLERPVRTYAEACRDIAFRHFQKWRAQAANQNAALHLVRGGRRLRRGYCLPKLPPAG